MYKLAFLLLPCLLSVVLVHGYVGGGRVLTQGYPFHTYRNALNMMYYNHGWDDDRKALAYYRNPNRLSFLCKYCFLSID